MLIVILVISIILAILSFVIDDGCGTIGYYIGLILTIIAIVTVFVMTGIVANFPFNVEKRLEMYEQENIAIEEKVKETVRAYMEYEQETYDSLIKDADLMTLIIKYPELNSNELVKVEIEMYKENNKQIKILKEEKINKKTMSWWLYFGDGE